MLTNFDDLKGKVCVMTGGAGVIGATLARGLANAGIKTAIVDINEEAACKLAAEIEKETGVKTIGVMANVLDKESLEAAKAKINAELGKIELLINGAGGNSPKATTAVEQMTEEDKGNLENTFYGLSMDGFEKVYNLNFKGTLLPTMVFTGDMLESGKGAIMNISSMNSYRPLTKIPAYSAAKASINNLTQWLAVHFAKIGIRCNAIAPGFFLTNQNRFLLMKEDGTPTPRTANILHGTPMGKFGEPEDLVGATLYLLSDISSFVTGIVIPIDGGFSAFSGV